MEKQILLMKRSPNQSEKSFTSWLLDELAISSLAANEDLTKCVLNIPDHDRGSDGTFDAVAEVWGTTAALSWFRDALWTTAKVDQCVRYSVTEWVEKGKEQRGGAAPGIKIIGCVAPFAHLDAKQTKEYWDRHVPLALDIHIGISRYIRNWVTHRDVNAPNFFGFPMLYFPTDKDFRDRYFRSAEAKRLHAADVGQFVGSGVRFVTKEHVFTRESPK